MGFGVLDSDESNQSSVVSSAIPSFPAPNSALSMIPNEISDESNVDESDLAEPFSETESNLEHSSQHTLSDLHLSSNEANSLPTLNGSESKESYLPVELKSEAFQVYQDCTPAALIPSSRTTFRGIINSVGNQSCTGQSTSMAGDQTFVNPPEGRAIRGGSMKSFQKETDSLIKHKGRSPLAAIGNATPQPSPDTHEFQKSEMDECFFMYRKQDPRLYTGSDNFAKLSDEVLLSIFKWLPKKTLSRCSLVNHRFHRVVQDESLWTRLDLAGKTIQPFAFGRILMRGTIILRLAQSKVCLFVTFQTLISILMFCSFIPQILEPIFDPLQIQKDYLARVQYLDLSMAVISTDALVLLFSKCRQLRKLSLEHVPVNDAVCKALAQNRKLEVLNLTMCTGLTTHGTRKLLNSLKRCDFISHSMKFF